MFWLEVLAVSNRIHALAHIHLVQHQRKSAMSYVFTHYIAPNILSKATLYAAAFSSFFSAAFFAASAFLAAASAAFSSFSVEFAASANALSKFFT